MVNRLAVVRSFLHGCSSLAVLGMVNPPKVDPGAVVSCSSLAVLGMVNLIAIISPSFLSCSSLAVLGMVNPDNTA